MPVISSDRTRPGTWRHIARIAIAPLMALGVGAIGAMAEAPSTLAEQRLQYDAVRAKSIIELQPFRHEMSASLPDSDQTGAVDRAQPCDQFVVSVADRQRGRGQANLLPHRKSRPDRPADRARRRPGAQHHRHVRRRAMRALVRRSLTAWRGGGVGAVRMRRSVMAASTCAIRPPDRPPALNAPRSSCAITSGRAKSLCGSCATTSSAMPSPRPAGRSIPPPPGNPKAGRRQHRFPTPESRPVITAQLGLALSGTKAGQMTMGLWHPVESLAGVYASAIEPKAISADILKGPGTVNPLDSVERGATDYLVAFDLSLSSSASRSAPIIRGSTGRRARPPRCASRGLPGPDGVGRPKPLVTARHGQPRPVPSRTVATFTGGFKRQHGAFKFGPIWHRQPRQPLRLHRTGRDLQQAAAGPVDPLRADRRHRSSMKTWTEADNALLPRISVRPPERRRR